MEKFLGCLGLVLIAIAFAALEGWIFMLLWNWLMPMIWTTAPILTFWQSWGLLILMNLILSPLRNTNKS